MAVLTDYVKELKDNLVLYVIYNQWWPVTWVTIFDFFKALMSKEAKSGITTNISPI